MDRARPPDPKDAPEPLGGFEVSIQAASAASCLYCRDAFAEGERLYSCEGCGAGYHPECLRQELGRCATLGCAGERAQPQRARGEASYRVERLLREHLAETASWVAESRPPAGKWSRVPERERPLACNRGRPADAVLLTDVAIYPEGYGTPLSYAELGRIEPTPWGVRLHRREEDAAPLEVRLPAQSSGPWRRALAALCGKPFPTGKGAFCDDCLEDFVPGSALSECLGCGSSFHAACFQTRRGCVTGESCLGARVVSRARVSNPHPSRCAECDGLFGPGQGLLVCDGCAARYHAACLREAGGCQVVGCAGRRATPSRNPGHQGSAAWLLWVAVTVGALLLASLALGG